MSEPGRAPLYAELRSNDARLAGDLFACLLERRVAATAEISVKGDIYRVAVAQLAPEVGG